MTIVLGIESTAHTFGIAILRDREVLANERTAFTTEEGGMIPAKVALHHEEAYLPTLRRALEKAQAAGVMLGDVKLIAYSDSPGIGHTLRIGAAAAKSLALQLGVSLVGVNHCIAHLEVAALATPAKDPVLLYCSGANTQVIAYDEGKYRIFGETLDTGIGNFLDTVARDMGLGFPGGPKMEKLALDAVRNWEKNSSRQSSSPVTIQKTTDPQKSSQSETVERNNEEEITDDGRGTQAQARPPTAAALPPLIPLPYSVKGMDVAFAGLQTHVLHKIKSGQYANEDLAYSIQEHVFAMLVETAERAMAHIGKDELVLGGGVACNKRLQEMCRLMCEDRGAQFYCPANEFLVDNAAMIAWTGALMHERGKIASDIESATIKPYERTDDVVVTWR